MLVILLVRMAFRLNSAVTNTDNVYFVLSMFTGLDIK